MGREVCGGQEQAEGRASGYVPYRKQLVPLARRLRKHPTEPEKRLWYRCLKKLKLHVYRQRPMLDYIVDFEIREARLVIELDGESHYAYPSSRRRDQERDRRLAQYGYRVLRFTNREVMEDCEAVCERILKALMSRLPSQGDA